MIAALESTGQAGGIATDMESWNRITGNWKEISNLPLWWWNNDYKANYYDFQTFGGWVKPAMKMYQSSTFLCGVYVDMDVY